MNKEEQWRRQGMNYALEVAKKEGIEGLEKDLKMRGAIGLPLKVSKAALDKFIKRVKNNTVDCMIILMAATLHDEFDFGAKRCQRAIDRFLEKANCLGEDYCTWEDYIAVLKDELGIELEIRKNDTDVKC